ncbi:MAG: insulinase family protein [Planctomycetes bacterium]|nr:insulinase family protein [Planctomycetota bacterium]
MKTGIQLEIGERQLPSGLTLLAIRNSGVQTFAGVVSLDIHGADEPADQSGLANLVGACLDEGTEKYDDLELARAAESLGASLDGNHRGGIVMGPAKSQKQALALLREMVTRPTFPTRAVKRVQAEVLTEIAAEDDDPRIVAARRFRKAVYGKHPLARPSQGTAATVARLSPKDLRAYHQRWFRPAGGYVAVAAPDEVEDTLDRLEKTFRSFRGDPVDHVATPKVELAGAAQNAHIPMAREQVHVYLGHLGIRRADPDFYVLSVMDHILGTGPGFTSRCARKLRDEQGLCYAVSAGITGSAGEEPGTFTAYIGTSPEHRQRAIDGFLAEIERIRREPPGADELADVKKYLTGSFVFAFERSSNLAGYAIRCKRFGLGFDFLHRYPDIVRAVTAEQVREAAERNLHPDRLAILSAGAS